MPPNSFKMVPEGKWAVSHYSFTSGYYRGGQYSVRVEGWEWEETLRGWVPLIFASNALVRPPEGYSLGRKDWRDG